MSERKFTVICEKDGYAVIDRNDQLKEIAVITGFNNETGEYSHTVNYWGYSYNGKEFENMTKAQALFNALNLFRYRTEENFITYDRMTEIATKMKDGFIETDSDAAREYIETEVEPEDYEVDFLGITFDEDSEGIEEIDLVDGYAEDEDYCPSSTRGDYSPSNPWDAPGMSIRDFI